MIFWDTFNLLKDQCDTHNPGPQPEILRHNVNVDSDSYWQNACFFTAPIRLNPTTNTPIPDRPARFLFFAPIAKYLDEIFPDPDDPEVSILSPDIPDTDRTGPVSGPFYVRVCC